MGHQERVGEGLGDGALLTGSEVDSAVNASLGWHGGGQG